MNKRNRWLGCLLAGLLALPSTALANTVDFMMIGDQWGSVDLTQPSTERRFEDTLSRVYYLAFGPGFTYLQRHAVPVDQQVSVNGFDIHVIETVAFATEFEFMVEDEFAASDSVIGFTLISVADSANRLQGPTHELAVDETALLATLALFDETFSLQAFMDLGWDEYLPSFVATIDGRHYFVIEQFFTGSQPTAEHQASLILSTLSTQLIETYQDVPLVLAEILGLQGTFIQQPFMTATWDSALEATVLDLDEYIENLQTLELSAFEMSVGNRLLTNLALQDTFLHLQFRGDFLDLDEHQTGETVVLVDTATGQVLTPLYSVLFDVFDHELPDDQYNWLYVEAVFPVAAVAIDDLVFRQIRRSFDATYDLDVTLNFDVPVRELTTLSLGEGTIRLDDFPGFQVTELTVDNLSLTFGLTGSTTLVEDVFDWYEFLPHLDIDFVYADEPVRDLSGLLTRPLHWFIDENLAVSATLSTIVDTQRLEAVVINGVPFPVN